METSGSNSTLAAGVGDEMSPSSSPDHTATFLIGFGILLLFVIFGILASAFLCITLKKDPYLWDPAAALENQQIAVGDGGKNAKGLVSVRNGDECPVANNADTTTQL